MTEPACNNYKKCDCPKRNPDNEDFCTYCDYPREAHVIKKQ